MVVESELETQHHIQEETSLSVDDTLGASSAARGIQKEENVFTIENYTRAVCGLLGHSFSQPNICDKASKNKEREE